MNQTILFPCNAILRIHFVVSSKGSVQIGRLLVNQEFRGYFHFCMPNQMISLQTVHLEELSS